MTAFKEVANNHFKQLDLFTSAITRAHGKNHPEAFEVRELFSKIKEKTQAAGIANPNLDTEFSKLREVTNQYAVPDDVCETYAAVYNMLSEIDRAYQA